MAKKVLTFPSATLKTYLDFCVREEPTLFAASDRSGLVAFLNIDGFDNESLLRIIALNKISCILDLRPRPVFGRPDFNHKEIISYLHSRNVEYVEYLYMIRHIADHDEVSVKWDNTRLTFAGIEKALKSGLMLCVFDLDAVQKGWLDEVRHCLPKAEGFSAELHPHALTGFFKEVWR